MTKTIKEFYLNPLDGGIEYEYSDNSLVKFNLSDAVARTGTDYVKFNLNSNIPPSDMQAGMLTWNNQERTLDLRMDNNATLQLGMELYCPEVINVTTETILQGSIVYSTGEDALTGKLAIRLAIANQNFNSYSILGIATEDISPQGQGFITAFGLVRTLNTTGSLQGETWLSGNVLYISPTLQGQLTNVKPAPPYLVAPIAIVGKVHATLGNVFVRTTYTARPDYGNFCDTTIQEQTVINTPKAVFFNTNLHSYGVQKDTNDTSKIVCTKSGLYNFQFSLQVDKLNSTENLIWIWYRINGLDSPASASVLSIKGSNAFIVPSWNFIQSMAVGDYFQLMWATDSLNVRLSTVTNPVWCPTIPSALITVTQVDMS